MVADAQRTFYQKNELTKPFLRAFIFGIVKLVQLAHC